MSLLHDLLRLAAEEGVVSPAALAQRLDVSPALVEMMLADLQRQGYLKLVEGGCGGCSGCGDNKMCHSPQIRLVKFPLD